MKKSKKIIILCVSAFVALLVLLAVLSNKKEKNINNNTVVNTIAGNQNVVNNYIENPNEEENTPLYLTYEIKTEVYDVEGSENKIMVEQSYATVNSGNEDVKNNLQKNLDKIANDEFEDYKKQVEEKLKGDYAIDAAFMNYVGNLYVGWSFIDSRVDKNVISIKNQSEGGLGGVSWNNKKGYSFNAETGNLLKIEDLSEKGKNLKEFVNTTIKTHLKDNAEVLYVYDEIRENPDEKINIDNLTWYLSYDGLTICFEKYKVSPDTFEYTIPYEKLKGYMVEKYIIK